MGRAFVDLHCHTRASFDCLSNPADVMRAAAARGLTHLAITDHDRIDVALEARATAPAGLTIIVGEEVKTADGDLICGFLERAIPPGLSAAETVAEARAQGGLVGIPHPFDRMRGSLLKDAKMASLVGLVDWVEGHNARLIGNGNDQAIAFAARARAADRRRVRRALRHRGRGRLHRDGRRSVDARRPAGGAGERRGAGPRTRDLLRPRSGRRSPSWSSGPAATAGSSRTPAPRARPTGRRGERSRWGGPSADGGRTGRAGSVRGDGDQPRPGRRPGTPRAPSPPRGPRPLRRARRGGHRRAGLALAPAAPAADDHLDPHPAGHHRGVHRHQRRGARQGPGPHRGRQPGPRRRRVRHLLPGLPAARLALEGPAARHRIHHRDQGLDRDHLPVVAGQLRGAGQAGRPVSRLSPQDQQHGLAEQDLRDRVHRARP